MSLQPRYSLLTLLILTALVAVSVKLWYEPPYDTPLVWKWSKEKASLEYSTEQHLPDYEVELARDWRSLPFFGTLNIRSKQDRALIYSYDDGSKAMVFTRWKDILYVAEHSPIATGCHVVAVDLKSGKQLWSTRLIGIGPTGHSEYISFVNIETDGRIIIVAGNEAHGRYIEHLEIKTGKRLANKQFKSDPESLLGKQVPVKGPSEF